MRLFRRLPRGLLAAYGMAQWFSDLTAAEQKDLKEGYKRIHAPWGIPPESLYEGSIRLENSNSTQQRFLLDLGNCAHVVKNIALAERIWLMALDAKGDEPMTRHFVYNSLIELYYKQRETKADALERCVQYCIEDIERIEEFIRAWRRDEQERRKWAAAYDALSQEEQVAWYLSGDRDMHPPGYYDLSDVPEEEIEIPRIPSFQRLAIIYEKQGRIPQAIEICQRAISLGLRDSTKGGFEARLNRLQKKR